MSQLPPGLRARILTEARSAPSPTADERRSGVLVAAAFAVLATVLLGYWLGVAQRRAPSVLVVLAVGGALSAFGATWVAAARGKSMLGRPLPALIAVAVAAPLGLLAWAIMVACVDRGVVMTGGTTAQHMTCLVLTVLLALAPFVALAYARRGSDPVHPRSLGAALGAAAGAWGGAMIDVHCGLTTIEHLALGHALPIVLMTLLGALVGGRVLGVRE